MRQNDTTGLPDLDNPARWGLLVACLAWLALVFAPSFAPAYGDLLRWLLHPVCHQIPARSFEFLGETLGACHRCMGLYVGFTLGVLLWPGMRRAAARLAANPRWVVAFFVPLAIDWLVDNTPVSRFATGVLASFPVALLPLLCLAERRTVHCEGVK